MKIIHITNSKNKDKIREYNKQRQYQIMFCECCKKNINKRKKTQHETTKKHINNLQLSI
jgi:hypothetical protein